MEKTGGVFGNLRTSRSLRGQSLSDNTLFYGAPRPLHPQPQASRERIYPTGKRGLRHSERVYFEDARTFFRHITPRRFDLLEELHRCGPISINALAKLLKRNYKNVHDDVKALESIGLIERREDGRYSVPWDEINTSFKLAV